MNEWEQEPDRVEFEHCGFKCLIVRQPESKHLCGYVGLPRWHPYYGRDYDDIDVDVHGGLTFSREGIGETWDKGFWYLGFDCAHGGDLIPGHTKFSKKLGLELGEVYRNIEYVRKETMQLAEQMTATAIAERKFTNEY